MNYDLAVAYRICARCSAHKPLVHADDKLKLAQLCLRSFKASLGILRAKMYVLLDNCPPEYETMFKELWPLEDLVFLRYCGAGDQGTLKEQTRTLLTQEDAEIVYYAEDDYCYRLNEFQSAFDFLIAHPDADFVGVYDHPDIYKTALHGINHEWRIGEEVWRTCQSTTHTFLTTKTVLKKVRRVFAASYFGYSPDLSKWMALTKQRIGPWFALHALTVNKFWAFSIFMAWLFCWRQILFGRRYKLWIRNPSIATHMVAGQEAPHVNWKDLWKTLDDSL